MTDMPPPPPNPSFPQPGSPQGPYQPGPSQPGPYQPGPYQPGPYQPGPSQVPGGPPPGFGGPGANPYGAPGFQPSAPPRRSGKAITAMVLGIAGVVLCFLGLLSLLALVFGILGLREIKRSAGARTGKGMAVTGVVLGVVGLVVGIGFWALVASEIAGTTAVGDLEVGDCVELPDDGEEISRIETFDCADPHPAEVIAVDDLRQGDEDFPGNREVSDRAAADCIAALEDYVGVPYGESVYELFPITPIEDNWDRDSEYICLAFEPGEDLTGSIEDSNR